MRPSATTHLALAILVLAIGSVSGGCRHDAADPSTTAPEASTGPDAPGTSDGPADGSGTTELGSTGGIEPVTTTDSTEGSSGEPEPTIEEVLEGRWISEQCEPAPQADGSTLYVRRDFELGQGDWSIEATIFGDEGCTFPLLTLGIAGDYAVGEPSAVKGAHEAEFGRGSVVLTPHVQDFVDLFDSVACSPEPWAIDQARDVSETGCAFIPSASACPIEYDLVSPSGDDRLYFGERPVAGDMCSPRSRPQALGGHAVVRQR